METINPKLLSASQLATRYGVRPKTIRTWARRRILPVIQLSSRCLRFDPQACDAALDRRNMLAAESPDPALPGSSPTPIIKRRNVMPRFNVTVRP